MSSIDHELRLALSTGKVQLGSKQAVREMRRGRARMTILSSNCPMEKSEAIKKYGKLAEIPVLEHAKDSVDLGVLCGKPYPVSAIVINDPGDSRILEVTEEE
ncbi:MAG: 50S ribosomal protein L30e [Candidatus Bathyarchaeota archaeon]|nr:50S ribosomal protein L30e [Candidatus Bathyarchaeota archaeon]